MCGVFGVLGSSFTADERRQIALNAVSAISHRGPDGWGLYSAPQVLLGHVRLSIVDVAAGHQPMSDQNTVVSFNGEIFNHIELRAELQSRGVKFATNSDTEVILKCYEAEGVNCFARFNGQFSILLWDKIKSCLVVARDRLGIRPLYVLEHGGGYFFSSEIKAFDTIKSYRRSFSSQHLFEHALFWNTLGDSTVYESIRSVESGTYQVYHLGSKPVVERYYQIGESSLSGQWTEGFQEATQNFRKLLDDSVSLRLRSDVPVGAYLSGGIDSTVISQVVKRTTGHPFKTFSVSFKDDEFDESYYQQMASQRIGSEHHCVVVDRQDIERNMLSAIEHTERPIFRTAPVPLYLLSDSVRQQDVKVVLTGEGADEILYGYDSFKELKMLDQWRAGGDGSTASEQIKQLYPHLTHYADSKRFGLMKMYYEGFLGDYDNDLVGLNIRLNNNKIIESYLNKDLNVKFDKQQILTRLQQTLPAGFSSWSLLQKNSFLEIKTLLQGYLLSSQGDRMALGHGIEGRFPFLDHRVLEYAFAMPDDYKLKGFDQKHILKRAYADEIPREILDRPKRPYMAPDLTAFIKSDGQLTDIASEMLSQKAIDESGLFDSGIVSRFLKKFSRGVPENTGYRDNMIFIFLLSTQMCSYWLKNPAFNFPDMKKCTVDIVEGVSH